eukprot:TRINITY_DN3143_c0_g1_i1.p2 TRINITY_DN3143_c0_g1~~TRINITY_DN3143_c0_g1_i1.p2  ORF type:complete len:200 (+),score=59.39 TRINITY_DN3143_c0_g1_i1:45-644(+)
MLASDSEENIPQPTNEPQLVDEPQLDQTTGDPSDRNETPEERKRRKRKERRRKKREKRRQISDEYQVPQYINVDVTDPITETDDNEKPTFTTYLISVDTTFPQYNSQNFSIRRRYSEFAWLRDHLKSQLDAKGKRLTIAELPGNTISSFLGLSGRYDEDFIEKRREGLANFLKSVVNHPWARFESGLHKFLQDEDFKCK